MGNIKAMSVLPSVVLAIQPFDAVAQTAGKKKATIKEEVAAFPVGSIVEVGQKCSGRIRGKLVSVTEDDFEIQSTKSGNASTMKIAYANVKSIQAAGIQKAEVAAFPIGRSLKWGGTIAAGSGANSCRLQKTTSRLRPRSRATFPV